MIFSQNYASVYNSKHILNHHKIEPSDGGLNFDGANLIFQPTPSLTRHVATSIANNKDCVSSPVHDDEIFSNSIITPNQVQLEPYQVTQDDSWFSPVWYDNIQLDNLNVPSLASITYHDFQSQHSAQTRATDVESDLDTDLSNNPALDFVEQGSGFGWLDSPSKSTPDASDSNSKPNLNRDPYVQPTPVLKGSHDPQTVRPEEINRQDSSNSIHNKPPKLSQRLPNLITTAGRVWRYFIPYDTFVDEDGDLRQLKSIVLRQRNESDTRSNQIQNQMDAEYESIGNFYSWLQYDQSAKLLYALPIEKDVGVYPLVLMVSDQLKQINQETFEIAVRQHQSIRAFTHTFSLNQITVEYGKFPSMIDAIGELIKRISSQLFHDHPFKNLIIHSYEIVEPKLQKAPELNVSIDSNTTDMNPSTITFNLIWSNSSVPIHPCNLTQIDQMARQMIDNQIEAIPVQGSDWLLDSNLVNRNFTLSLAMIQSLRPDFSASNIAIQLRGACESQTTKINEQIVELVHPESPRVRIKLGKLNWLLGEPIEYQIPAETFEARGRRTLNARDFNLSLHTIDGLTLDEDSRYSYLDFDSETQTIYGLPYSLTEHVGQRELQLTAYDPASNLRVREVFIINIDAQDLTLRDNRAFKMSMYLVARTKSFGPRERVALGHKIMGSLRFGDTSFRQTSQIGEATTHHELVAIDIQKFAIDSPDSSLKFTSLSLSDDAQAQYSRIVKVPDGDSNDPSVYTMQISSNSDGSESTSITEINRDDQSNFLYKFIWTNETIGYRGDCPEEVIKYNIVETLEQFMWDYFQPTMSYINQDQYETEKDRIKASQARFYEKLRRYFEPESRLMHLRIEPLGACMGTIDIYDVGNSELAAKVDGASIDSSFDSSDSSEQALLHLISSSNDNGSFTDLIIPRAVQHNRTSVSDDPARYEEYWLIFAIIVALLFVIVVFALGMHTYKENQDKSFELQVRLAQARQNSMFLSQMVLANQLNPADITSQQQHNQLAKSMCVVQDEERSSRKPVILDGEKEQLLYHAKQSNNNNQWMPVFRPTMAQLTDQNAIQSLALSHPLQSQQANGGSTIFLNGPQALANQLPGSLTLNQMGPSPSMATIIANPIAYQMLSNNHVVPYQSMTLNRRLKQPAQIAFQNPAAIINHSQSILTVASLSNGTRPQMTNAYQPTNAANLHLTPRPSPNQQQHHQQTQPNQQRESQAAPMVATRSPSSYSSSNTSVTAQSIISNPNFIDPDRINRN